MYSEFLNNESDQTDNPEIHQRKNYVLPTIAISSNFTNKSAPKIVIINPWTLDNFLKQLGAVTRQMFRNLF